MRLCVSSLLRSLTLGCYGDWGTVRLVSTVIGLPPALQLSRPLRDCSSKHVVSSVRRGSALHSTRISLRNAVLPRALMRTLPARRSPTSTEGWGFVQFDLSTWSLERGNKALVSYVDCEARTNEFRIHEAVKNLPEVGTQARVLPTARQPKPGWRHHSRSMHKVTSPASYR
jgi:hypothetical protein